MPASRSPRSEVHFICVADDHGPRRIALEFGLCVHLREWAFCPAGEPSGHHWRRIEAIALAAVIAPLAGEAVVAAD
ncbi:MAG: hypothetical protein QOH08_2078 [Chloroflexota bacterium]|jgi:hypothetical protein|nr:hypothetical protein [Chloroflexota bacterium]